MHDKGRGHWKGRPHGSWTPQVSAPTLSVLASPKGCGDSPSLCFFLATKMPAAACAVLTLAAVGARFPCAQTCTPKRDASTKRSTTFVSCSASKAADASAGSPCADRPAAERIRTRPRAVLTVRMHVQCKHGGGGSRVWQRHRCCHMTRHSAAATLGLRHRQRRAWQAAELCAVRPMRVCTRACRCSSRALLPPSRTERPPQLQQPLPQAAPQHWPLPPHLATSRSCSARAQAAQARTHPPSRAAPTAPATAPAAPTRSCWRA